MCFSFLEAVTSVIKFERETTYTIFATSTFPPSVTLQLLCFAKNFYYLFCTSTSTTIENSINLFCTTFFGENNKLRFRVCTSSVLNRKWVSTSWNLQNHSTDIWRLQTSSYQNNNLLCLWFTLSSDIDQMFAKNLLSYREITARHEI